MKENEKREFAKKLEQTAQELKENVEAGNGRAYILIGSDRIEGDDKDGGGEYANHYCRRRSNGPNNRSVSGFYGPRRNRDHCTGSNENCHVETIGKQIRP